MDEYFVEAAKFVIEKNKASIGMLQRYFKIGFNRAARIMDELCEAGIIGKEIGTKPREILIGLEKFDELLKSGNLDERTKEKKLETQKIQEVKFTESEIINTCKIMSAIILETYKSFGVDIEFANFRFEDGNAIFGIIPKYGVRVKTVMSYEKDLSLRLGAEVKMKLLAGYIGIFMPILQFRNRMETMIKSDIFSEYYKN